MERPYVLSVPGEFDDGETDLGMFSNRAAGLVGFRPGIHFTASDRTLGSVLKFPDSEFEQGSGTWTRTEIGSIKVSSDIFCRGVTGDRLDRFEKLLREYKIRHVRDSKSIVFCCEETTKDTSTILALNFVSYDKKFGIENHEILVFAAPETILYRVRARAHIPEFLPEDEELELAIVRDTIEARREWEKLDEYVPPPRTL